MQIKDKNLYYVGGVVRDEILGLKSLDIDYCYEGNAINFAQNLNIIKTNQDFGTVRVLTPDGEIDIASTRTEVYPKPGHLPVIEKIGCNLKEDLKRRDFTINALAKNTLTSEITDYFSGLEDIKNKKIRVLHEKSFIDDPSRIIRALKFAIRFGFELSEDTKKLQEAYLNNINYDMSYHRIKKELKETFNINKKEVWEKFVENGIYKLLGPNQIVPNIDSSIESLINDHKPVLMYMIYIGLFNLLNFELTAEEQNIIDSYYQIKECTPESIEEIYELFYKKPIESIIMYAATVNKNIAEFFLYNLSKIKISLTGEDLINLGLKQGEIFNKILKETTYFKLNNPEITKEDEINFVRKNFL